MKYICLICCLCISFYSFSNVTVSINGNVYVFEGNPRLSQVLAPSVDKANWYWPVTRLYKSSSDKSELIRQDVLADLVKIMQDESNPKYKKAYQYLHEQIQNWQLADRIFIPLDYDLARVQEKYNPKFEAGDYILQLSDRPQTVSVFGMLEKVKNISIQPMANAFDYLKNMQREGLFDKSFAYIVQGNGTITKSGIAYWNKSNIQIMPGGQIYIPIEESVLSNHIEELNNKIAVLAANRVLNK